MIEFNNLSVKIGDTQILKNLNGKIERGQITAILGANGAGKSTLLHCLASVLNHYSGEISLDNVPVQKVIVSERAKKIGFLEQKGDINWDIDAETLIGLGRLVRSDKNDALAVYNAMIETDTLHLRNKVASKLSGGEKSRVLLARVLAGQPEYILADEPLAALDPAHQIDALTSFRDIAKSGVGIAIVLHDLTYAARLADNVIMMKDGEIIAQGQAKDVLTPEILAEAYGIKIYTYDSDGTKIIVPYARI